MEAMAARRETGGNPVNVTPDQIIPEDRDDAREWADPAQALAARAVPAPAHGLGPGQGTDDRDDCLGEYLLRRKACDRKSAEVGKRLSVMVDLGGRRAVKKKNRTNIHP